ncbi:MAG: hypothetical protein OHK0038_12040 [Flammeovirgaceae bacterium]
MFIHKKYCIENQIFIKISKKIFSKNLLCMHNIYNFVSSNNEKNNFSKIKTRTKEEHFYNINIYDDAREH